MRIIGGTKKGHIIRPPRGLPIRPITDKSKESLFNMLQHLYDFEECEVLDLFTGSGNITLEFASRGAIRCVAIDKHPGCSGFVKSESKALGFSQVEVIRGDVMQYIKNTYDTFDVIFCDAPYAWTQYEEMIRIILDRKLLKEGGRLIVEHHSVTKLEHIPELEKQRAHGQNILSFFMNEGEGSEDGEEE